MQIIERGLESLSTIEITGPLWSRQELALLNSPSFRWRQLSGKRLTHSLRHIEKAASVGPEQKKSTMVIIKFFEWLKIQPDFREVVYELCDDDFKKVRQLNKEEAIELINENHLTRVHRDKYGAIWR